MRVLHIIGSMDPHTGGPCQGIRSSSTLLENLNVHREVVCFDSPNADYLGMDRFPVNALGKGRTPWQYNPKLIPWLRENLHRFDVVISNGLWLYHTYAIHKVLQETKQAGVTSGDSVAHLIKWFVMPHGMLDPWFQDVKGREWKAIRNWFYWKLIENKVVRDADGLLFTSETEKLLARKPFRPYRPKQEIDVGYGVEVPPPFSDTMHHSFLERCPYIQNQSYFLFLSRIHYKKGVDLLIKAYINLLQTNINLKVAIPKLVIAGPGLDTSYGQMIIDLFKKNPQLKNNLFFTGMLTGDAKWGALYNCEAFILPSHQENFGIAVTEALSCGKPVLISNQVNIWREIESDGGGLVAENTIEGTQYLLTRWLELTPEDKKVMSQKATYTFKQNFTVEQAAKRLKEAIT